MNKKPKAISQFKSVAAERAFWETHDSAELADWSKAERRTIASQVEFRASVGRAALDNSDLPVTFVAESLLSMSEPREHATPFVPRSSKA